MSDEKKEEVFKFLDGLRESGVTNMFGSAEYVLAAFPEFSKREARDLVVDWMKAFEGRHFGCNL